MFRDPVKNPRWFMRKVELRESSIHGHGVFATEPIAKHEIFESCPVILFHHSLLRDYFEFHAITHILSNYVFKWTDGNVANVLGYGMMYNHSNDNANASYGMRIEEEKVEFWAKRDIEPGEEILIHYNRGRGSVAFDETGGHYHPGKLSFKQRRAPWSRPIDNADIT